MGYETLEQVALRLPAMLTEYIGDSAPWRRRRMGPRPHNRSSGSSPRALSERGVNALTFKRIARAKRLKRNAT